LVAAPFAPVVGALGVCPPSMNLRNKVCVSPTELVTALLLLLLAGLGGGRGGSIGLAVAVLAER
jgi:hypothetical protein